MPSRTILIGGTGFLGPIILKKYPDIISVGRSMLPSDLYNKHIHIDSVDNLSVLDNIDFDKVIFLIGNSNHFKINKENMMGIEYNLIPLKKALHYFRNKNLKKFIAFTGALLYDVEKIQLPVDESQPLNPYTNQYIFSKFLAEEVTKLYPEVPVINVRLSNIYGPTKLIRPDVVPKIMYQALSPSENIEVWTSYPQRDLIFAEDAAEAIVSLLDTDYTGPINVGTGESHSIGEVLNIVTKLSGKKIKDLCKVVSGPMKYKHDISLLQSLTKWKPRHSLEEGITKTYNEMKSYANECRWWEKTNF